MNLCEISIELVNISNRAELGGVFKAVELSEFFGMLTSH